MTTPTSFEGERISKVISRAGVASRRDAERFIAAGRVKVNGKTIDSPALNVTQSDIIEVDGVRLDGSRPTTLWLYHKPQGLITTHSDPEGRPTVFEHLPTDMPRVISVGRLDMNSEGLLLLTNDGELARFMESPETAWQRNYRVRMHGFPSDAHLVELKKGITIDGFTYRGIGVKREEQQSDGANQWAMVSLTEGKNREIRKVFEHFGCPVSRLIRVSYGPFQLGNLPLGEVKEVSTKVLLNTVGKQVKIQPCVL